MKPPSLKECARWMERNVESWEAEAMQAPDEELEILAILKTLAAGMDARTVRVNAAGESVNVGKFYAGAAE